ncbi:MAG: hypothetical protein COB02_12480 [Candidatus Cloacimonadota bacterium]|nr:MAG: hypothetical protein COB02_12480 [Candidatus Cloacimonadota bacterium]
MLKKILYVLLIVMGNTYLFSEALPIQLVYIKSNKGFEATLNSSLKSFGYKLIQQKNIPKDYIKRNMIRLEIHIFLSALPIFRDTEFGMMGNRSHNPFEIELNINLSGKNQRGKKINEHLILSQTDYTGVKTVQQIYNDVIQELINEITKIQFKKSIILN